MHPSKGTANLLKALLKANASGNIFRVLYIGANYEDILNVVEVDQHDQLKTFFTATDFATQEDVSTNFQLLDGYLSDYVDGVSTRRGTILVALEHGVPIISTDGESTSSIFKDQDFITLFNTKPLEFENALLDAL